MVAPASKFTTLCGQRAITRAKWVRVNSAGGVGWLVPDSQNKAEHPNAPNPKSTGMGVYGVRRSMARDSAQHTEAAPSKAMSTHAPAGRVEP